MFEVEVSRAIGAVVDPELGDVTIGELGLVRSVAVDDEGHVSVALTPTFLGCPALSLIASDVVQAVKALGVAEVSVRFVASPVWSPMLISEIGRKKLAELCIGVESGDGSVGCPYCDGRQLSPRVPVGSTSCRSVWWCSACRTVVDVMRSAPAA